MPDGRDRCALAMRVVAATHPWLLLPYMQVRHLLHVVEGGVDTVGVFASGRIILNRYFIESLTIPELGAVLCHELLHLALGHGARGQEDTEEDEHRLNVAFDMCINTTLREEGLQLPGSALFLPHTYDGERVGEQVARWLLANPDCMPRFEPRPGFGRGCGLARDGSWAVVDEDGQPLDWRLWRQGLRHGARVGGHARLVGLLEERPPRVPWRQLLRQGACQGLAEPGRSERTMARPNRRSAAAGLLLPGWRGSTSRVCVVADVSGSMPWGMVEQIRTECRSLLHQFPGLRLTLIVHTAVVEWEGEVGASTLCTADEALHRTGGTDPVPAYEAARRRGPFDTLVHFTDGFFEFWPEVPARRLVVGLFGQGGAPTPAGARVVPCNPA